MVYPPVYITSISENRELDFNLLIMPLISQIATHVMAYEDPLQQLGVMLGGLKPLTLLLWPG